MSKNFPALLGFFSIVLFFSCKPKMDVPQPSAGDADFTKTVALGGNFLSGYQDGALYQKSQELSIPALLSRQFELVGGGAFLQSLIPVEYGVGINAKPWESPFVSKSTLGYKINCLGEQSLSPLKTLLDIEQVDGFINGKDPGTEFQNFAIPFAKVNDILDPGFSSSYASGNLNPFFSRFARTPGESTLLKSAADQNPTFSVLWLGMEDVFDYARNGGVNSSIPSSFDFSSNVDTILSQLTANGSKGVIANIPELNSFPFYSLIPWNGLDLNQGKTDSLNLTYFGSPPYCFMVGPDAVCLDTFSIGKNGFMIQDPNSSAPPAGYRKMANGEYIMLTIPLDSMKCYKMGSFFPLPDNYVLDESEIKVINQAIADYNVVIAAMALKYDLAFADMNSYFKKIKEGIKWDGADFNAEFVSGGFYSLDGFHPNQKGYALVANEFILAINQKYNAVIPTVNCSECSGVKFP